MNLEKGFIKKVAITQNLDRTMVELAAEMLAVRTVAIIEAETFGLTKEEMEEKLDFIVNKVAEMFEDDRVNRGEDFMKNLEQTKRDLLLEDAEIQVIMI